MCNHSFIKFRNCSGISREVCFAVHVHCWMILYSFTHAHSWACLSPGSRRWWNSIYQVGKDNLSRYARGWEASWWTSSWKPLHPQRRGSWLPLPATQASVFWWKLARCSRPRQIIRNWVWVLCCWTPPKVLPTQCSMCLVLHPMSHYDASRWVPCVWSLCTLSHEIHMSG